MAVDKNLFLHDLAVVAILKNEGPYVKEWLDYHLLAGVDHFYIYDNDSPDNQKEVLKPYIDAGLVTYTFLPGKVRQIESYNMAAKNFRFACRYMAFIDGDEFIFPKSDKSISEVADEILSGKPNVTGLAINWQCFGSSNEEKADYTRGVLERFTHRAPTDWFLNVANKNAGNKHVKTIANPRYINYFNDPHHAKYFINCQAINEVGKVVNSSLSFPIAAEKIVVNHYHIKSREEWENKVKRGRPTLKDVRYNVDAFREYDHNEEFDDGILKYRDARAGAEKVPENPADVNRRLITALIKNLSPKISDDAIQDFFDNQKNKKKHFAEIMKSVKNAPVDSFKGKLETFLTCLEVAAYLQSQSVEKATGKSFEEISLNAIAKTLMTSVSIPEVMLLLSDMPKILCLPHAATNDIRNFCIRIIPKITEALRLSITSVPMNILWRDIVEMNYTLDMLKAFESKK